ncbi:aldo/keto reductase [Pseudoalteromonas sp. SMS1]|uniref:aldo/keto reductase n=1 Tax=Pseudoalteromonas sp. SMS1 TaxID=2908894 RepID=UPI001F277C4B|nr:aldo/keto reductase [Pseudoalteromonas sp. SMS1]MCF2859374.1 aldo/keto reductase [Pseudoalteromonas sp. SMS1]
MRLALGSVQFGLDYGVSNTSGQPPLDEVEKILRLAVQSNIDVVDTAIAYGQSHAVLGKLKHVCHHLNIVTKLPPLQASSFDSDSCEAYQNMLLDSFDTLNCDEIYGVLFHQSADIIKAGNRPLLDSLEMFKKQGKIRKIGVSLYSNNNMDDLLSVQSIGLVQLPFNAFDTFFANKGYLKEFNAREIEVHVRSAFLQGLLLMALEDMPSYFAPWRKQLTNFKNIATEFSASSLELALAYVLKHDEIDKIVIGVNSEQELQQILSAYHQAEQLSKQFLPDISVSDSQLTNPAHWHIG